MQNFIDHHIENMILSENITHFNQNMKRAGFPDTFELFDAASKVHGWRETLEAKKAGFWEADPRQIDLLGKALAKKLNRIRLYNDRTNYAGLNRGEGQDLHAQLQELHHYFEHLGEKQRKEVQRVYATHARKLGNGISELDSFDTYDAFA